MRSAKVSFILLVALYSTACQQNIETLSAPASPAHELAKMEFKKEYSVFGDLHDGCSRIFLVHGLRSSEKMFATAPYVTLKDGLVNSCNQVVTFSLPYAERYFFEDGGIEYRRIYKEFLDFVISDTDQKYGVTSKMIIGGVSFGGLHAMMGATIEPRFTRFFGILPVTRIYALDEFKGLNATEFDPFNEVSALATKDGLLQYGTSDYRVDYRLTVELASNIGQSVQTIERIGETHDTSNPDILTSTISWVNK